MEKEMIPKSKINLVNNLGMDMNAEKGKYILDIKSAFLFALRSFVKEEPKEEKNNYLSTMSHEHSKLCDVPMLKMT